ncbi:MAG: NF038122 family metalloprotease, partial [Pirellulales bacterium]|nr:NF038122 family metalloprotease [Pirellulales bacterium]
MSYRKRRSKKNRYHAVLDRPRRSYRRFKPMAMEWLEDRRMLAVEFLFNASAGTPLYVIEGFEEAGELWERFIDDDVTVVVDIASADLGGPLGTTSNNREDFSYTQVRNALLSDSTSVDDVVAGGYLPNGTELDVYINFTSDNPNGSGSATPYIDNDGGANNTTFSIPRANARALGLISATDSASDGSITFDTINFTFDFDRSDGITPGQIDFVFVAAHEIGHLLGFTSGVDVLDINDGQMGRPGPFDDDSFINISVLDLFRSSAESVTNGADLDFTADARTKNFSIDGGATTLGTFSTGRNNGDGEQASHWEDGLGLGIMDPTAGGGAYGVVTALDLIAFDVIGWNLALEDRFESNDTIGNASHLGSESEITLNDLMIGSGDVDYFEYTAHDTGKMIVTAQFKNDAGDIDLQIVDENNNVIASSTTTANNEIVVIPVVSQERYFIRVYGFPAFAVNDYSLEIENFAAPVPDSVVLDPTDDTGSSNSDNVTLDPLARIFVEADLADFASSGIDILDPTEVAGNESGAAVQVFVNGAAVGYATPVPGTGNSLFGYTFGAGELSTTFIPVDGGGGLNFIKAAVRIFDGQKDETGTADPATGRTNLSEPLLLVLDTTPPVATAPDMLASSDTGLSHEDNVTSINTPAFTGTAEPNAKVRIYAQNIDTGINDLVGQGVANYDGIWEITIEPLADGTYDMTVRIEDIAGNLSEPSESLRISIDADAPQRPTIDLIDADDTGLLDLDNVTIGDPTQGNGIADFRISAELGSTVVLKDGEVVIDTFIFDAAFDATDGVADHFGIRTIDFNANQTALNIPAEGPHPLSVEATDTTGNFTQSEQLLVTIDFTQPAIPVSPRMLTSSDSGLDKHDEVTNQQAPAFDGTGEANAEVRVYATDVTTGLAQLVGEGLVNSDESDSINNNGLGTWEITVEPLADGTYDITVEFEDLAGNVSAASDPLRIWIDTAVPNTPLLDLIEVSDTGRHDADNILFDNRPNVTVTANDTPDGGLNLFPNDISYRIYSRPDAGGDVLIVDSYLALLNNFTAVGFFQHELTQTLNDPNGVPFTDGVYNLKLEVEDRAGNVSPDFLLQITVDTTAPPVSFGLPGGQDGLNAASDSGVNTVPSTFADRITSDTTPALWGQAEADSVVRVYADVNGNGAVEDGDLLLGETVATPWDGNLAFTDGYWEITSVIDLNALPFPLDGLRQLLVSSEDVAGNVNRSNDSVGDANQQLNIFIDTQGPRVDSVTVTGTDYDLFDPKPSVNGPTPLVNSITIDLVDEPDRVVPGFSYSALVNGIATTYGNYTLYGDHIGLVIIESITATASPAANGVPATTSITLTFASPLPDDRYTLGISDHLVDPAGNRLDGESNADEPSDQPAFPSGDGVPGGSFLARFTVDTRPEIGTDVSQGIYIDINGNFVWDPASGLSDDATNADLAFTLPVAEPDGSIGLGGFNVHDLLFAGKFAPLGGLIVGDDAVFIIDVSGSTGSSFGGDPVGDLNGDGSPNTI